MDAQNKEGLANGKGSTNVACHIQGIRDVHGDDPSREDALEEHDDHKIDPALQAAQALDWAGSTGW